MVSVHGSSEPQNRGHKTECAQCLPCLGGAPGSQGHTFPLDGKQMFLSVIFLIPLISRAPLKKMRQDEGKSLLTAMFCVVNFSILPIEPTTPMSTCLCLLLYMTLNNQDSVSGYYLEVQEFICRVGFFFFFF